MSWKVFAVSLLLCVAGISAAEVADADLISFTDSLLSVDVNNAGHLVSVNLQTKYNAPGLSTNPLIKIGDTASTISTIQALLKIYESDGTTKYSTATSQFLDVILSTPVMQKAKNFLKSNGFIASDNEMRSLLEMIWFTDYYRGAEKSSGFKHVFMAEPGKNNNVNGLHNWIYFTTQEKTGDITNVFLKGVRRFNKDRTGGVLSSRFNWKTYDKPSGSFLLGTSPELDMALFTTCFVVRKDADCKVSVGGVQFTVKTFSWKQNGKEYVATAYPVA